MITKEELHNIAKGIRTDTQHEQDAKGVVNAHDVAVILRCNMPEDSPQGHYSMLMHLADIIDPYVDNKKKSVYLPKDDSSEHPNFKLFRCPICGGPAEINIPEDYKGPEIGYEVHCTVCDANLQPKDRNSAYRAALEWNVGVFWSYERHNMEILKELNDR